MTSKALNLMPALLVASILVVLPGCQQPNEKQSRLLAAQNTELQQQLAARQAEIRAIRHKHAEELHRQEEALTACKKRIEILQKDIEKGIAERVSGVTTALIDENAALRKEVQQLKGQIEELKKQVQP